MTERFTLTNPKNAFQEMKCGIDDRGNTLTFNEVVDMLNAFNDENEHLERLMRKSVIERLLNGFEKSYKDLEEENEQLHSELAEKDIQLDYLQNENKHFKQRNNRQAEQLDNLYNLIEKEDWQTLKGIIQEFQECEEQLQKEWKCYE